MNASTDARPWYACGLSFECTRCGRCCGGAPGYVWVTPEEVARLAAHVGLSEEEFQRRHTRRVGYGLSLPEKPGGDCEFLERLADGTSRCTVHPVRPVQCRTWPFWKSNLRSPEAWARVAADCPGIGHGPVHPLPVIDAALADNGSRPL